MRHGLASGVRPRWAPTLLRYRGAALAELTRSLRALKALQADVRANAAAGAEAPAPAPVRPAAVRPAAAAAHPGRPAARPKQPNEPEPRRDSGERARSADRAHPGGAPVWRDPSRAGIWPSPLPTPGGPTLGAQPIEPENPLAGGA